MDERVSRGSKLSEKQRGKEKMMSQGLDNQPQNSCTSENNTSTHQFKNVVAIVDPPRVGLHPTIYSWRKWENEASLALDANLQDASFEAMWQHLPQFVFRVTCTSGNNDQTEHASI
ncbi:hypothetical protein LOK49_LG03G00940 [Camellia lanceoleosa]|uniref:Uncharacterized protein n=1 Tax=Camellia lanceoleosa TaxID=1840588 RepID=A0ACC0IGJ6_9ERIC|nr:hypothetical protein LOK49_LG03G00940 [Camellia lanceoleosa]